MQTCVEMLGLAPGIRRAVILMFACVLGAPAAWSGDSLRSPSPARPNFLLLVADDLGADTLSCYGRARKTASTPYLDELCRSGVKFTGAWSQPSCTPSRTALLTGRYAFRTGSLAPAGPFPGFVQVPGAPRQLSDNALLDDAVRRGAIRLPEDAPFMVIRRTGKPPADLVFGSGPRDDEVTIASALGNRSSLRYSTAAIGKWHLANPRPDLADHPARLGFGHFAGGFLGGVDNYYHHELTIDGEARGPQQNYATSQQVDDALAFIRSQDGEQPWLVWLAFNAPHDPYHKPPDALISEASRALDRDGIAPANAQFYHRAMIEALDHEIGRLLAGIDEDVAARTYVVFLGDNGTVGPLIAPPYDAWQGKGSLYQGGVNVPLIVTGPGVEAREEHALVNFVDLFPTILDLAGAHGTFASPLPKPIDGISFADLLQDRQAGARRSYNFAEQAGFLPTGVKDEVAVSDGRYKLIVDRRGGHEQLFDLAVDPFEKADLLGMEDEAARDVVVARLHQAIADIRKSPGRLVQ